MWLFVLDSIYSSATEFSLILWYAGVEDLDITEFYITESAITIFQEFDIMESDITKKGKWYNRIRYNGIWYNVKLEIDITEFDITEYAKTKNRKLI